MNHPVQRHIQNEDPEAPRFLSEARCQALIAQVRTLGLEGGRIELESNWRGDIRWARNRITTASDWRDHRLDLDDRFIEISLNQVDDASLRAAVRWANTERRRHPDTALLNPPEVRWAPVPQRYPQTHIWSDATYAQSPEARSTIAGQLAAAAERSGMVSAGYASVEARGVSFETGNGLFLYAPQTIAQCSVTVRDPQGTGSGWAGASSYDWNRFDAEKLAKVALEKCLTSRNPVRIEPGRYTLIMEPQATFELIRQVLTDDYGPRSRNENLDLHVKLPFATDTAVQYGPIRLRKTRIGEKIFDERISIRSDPLDPDLGTLPFTYDGDPFVPVTWVDHGILQTLWYDRDYALRELHEQEGKPWSGAFRLDGSGPLASVDEMIATTQRGLLVTRFCDVRVIALSSVLCTGLTRDGLWLIERGKISKAVHNLRFTESPMFVFNNVEQIGASIPVFSPGTPAVVPPIKVRDFSFTSLVDAV